MVDLGRRTSSSAVVRVEGASCRLEPSPTARALRLEGLRVQGPDAVARLVARLPDPPWDARVAVDDPAGAWLRAAGFEPYAETAVLARLAEGIGSAAYVPGVAVEPYRTEWAEAFTAAEAAAMEGLATYGEMGSPTGYEEAAGMGVFLAARRGDELVGFAQASLPDGWLNWMGVVPGERRAGIGTLLLADVARAVRAARGSHLAAEVEAGGVGRAFLAARGFRERGRGVLLIRRA